MLKTISFVFALLTLIPLAHAKDAEKPSEATARFEKASGETAAFAAGCFWGTEEFFRKIPGVTATRVGYEGGEKPAKYQEVGTGNTGHTETLQLKYDPKKVSCTIQRR
jgi:hypothetical protein